MWSRHCRVAARARRCFQGITYYIVPWTNVWAQKLTGSGQILTSPSNPCDPGYLPLPTPAPQSYPVTIVELDAAPYSQTRYRVRRRLGALTTYQRKKSARWSRVRLPARHSLRQCRSGRCRPRRGFSLLETLLASVLATLLGLLLATSCATFGRPALEVDARARIAQEGILAAQSIACDLGGFMADSPGRTGTSSQYIFSGWDLTQGNALVLNYQGTTPTDLHGGHVQAKRQSASSDTAHRPAA